MRDLRVINRRHSKDNWRLLMMVATDARNKPDPVALLMTAIFLNAQKLLAFLRSLGITKIISLSSGLLVLKSRSCYNYGKTSIFRMVF